MDTAAMNTIFRAGSALSSDCTLLSLRAPIDLPFGGHAWFSLYPQKKGFKADIQALKALDRLEQLLEELIERYAPASGKVWLLGFSQGSMLSQALMLRKSEQIEGVIGLSGYLPDPLIPEAPSFARTCPKSCSSMVRKMR